MSYFREGLFEEKTLNFLNKAIEDGGEAVESLASLVTVHEGMTPEKEKEIERVRNILKPNLKFPTYPELKKQLRESVGEKEVESQEIKESTASPTVASRKPGRPKKIVVEKEPVSLQPAESAA